MALLGLATLAYEWNDIAAAEQHAAEVRNLGYHLADEEFVVHGSLVLARVQHARGETAHAQQMLHMLTAQTSDPALPQVYHAPFEHHVPVVTVENSMVTVQYRALFLIGWLVYGAHEPRAAITLNGAMPWEIEVHGGASKFLADLLRVSQQCALVLCLAGVPWRASGLTGAPTAGGRWRTGDRTRHRRRRKPHRASAGPVIAPVGGPLAVGYYITISAAPW